MDGWMDEQMIGWMHDWMDGWMDERRLTGPCACPSGIPGFGLGEESCWEVW